MNVSLRAANVGRVLERAAQLARSKAWWVQGPTLLLFVIGGLAIAETTRVRSPVSPQESLAHFVEADGLAIELAAHEPNVIDPVAIRFDEDGRMWVVEMRDYPTGSPDGSRSSRISVLEDKDGDGFFEAATVFADNLQFATGLQPWQGGAFVTMAGRIAYMKDTTGDGKADVDETWYTGFAQTNTQLRANHPTLALDNHIYVANGLRGGMIVDARQPDDKPVSISGMDFRFDPLTRKFEAVSGMGQFGLAFDDYGNRFVCTNRNPAIHIVLEDRYLKRNPLAAIAAVMQDVAKAGDESRVFPITRAWTTSHLHAGQFTAACGLKIYRGDALPPEFRGNIFVCEPTGHLVHREIMEPDGVTFKSRPAYEGAEFLVSRDEWCCPVNLETGPDGALYVVDMYRAVIEHPEWMPEELRKRPDMLEGNDRGRIYRIVPKGFRRPAPPHLSNEPSVQLVEYLAHPNAWWRETATRLILERQDKRIAQNLEAVALEHESPLARIHALRLLDGLQVLSDKVLLRALGGDHARVAEEAIRIVESNPAGNRLLPEPTSHLIAHRDARLRFQAVLTTLTHPIGKVPKDAWERSAYIIAVGDRGGTALARLLEYPNHLARGGENAERYVLELARLAAASPKSAQRAFALEALVSNLSFQRSGLAVFFGEVSRRGISLDELKSDLSADQRHVLDAEFKLARKDVTDMAQPENIRCEAIDLLAFAEDASGILLHIALQDRSQPVRMRAIAALAKTNDLEPWRALLGRFSHETPAVQREIVNGVFAHTNRLELLLDRIAAGAIAPTALDASRIKLLLSHRNEAIKQRAEKLLAGALPADRKKALADYQAVLSMQADASRGRAIFQKQCATCHRVGGIGVDVAPDISDSRERSPEQLLTDIIQPNRAIDSNFFSYTAVTENGQVHTGILTAETSTSLTLKEAEGKTVTLQRSEVEELYSHGVSFMPDGLEKLISRQEMADLIAYIKHWRYLDEDGPERAVSVDK